MFELIQNKKNTRLCNINAKCITKNTQNNKIKCKRYYNREAVVISALQVEKHPLTTPGPFSTPPPPRHTLHKNSLITMTPPMSRFEAPQSSRTASPIPRAGSCASGSYGSPRVGEGYRQSPKPHSSPKMKLRCLHFVIYQFILFAYGISFDFIINFLTCVNYLRFCFASFFPFLCIICFIILDSKE